jgi:hypothetical protein
MYTSTLALTSALDGGGGQRHASAALPPRKTQYPLCTRLGGPQHWRIQKFFSGGVQQIQLRIEGRENGDLGIAAL